jgi:hypothetical protein
MQGGELTHPDCATLVDPAEIGKEGWKKVISDVSNTQDLKPKKRRRFNLDAYICLASSGLNPRRGFYIVPPDMASLKISPQLYVQKLFQDRLAQYNSPQNLLGDKCCRVSRGFCGLPAYFFGGSVRTKL